jgi:glycosyltransferase involved in cell wall biosynthesis
VKPLASFVIPVKDGAAYLAECLSSCLAQTRRRIEVIVVDDGSTDSTPQIIEYFKKKDNRIRAFRFEENKGRSRARNVGMAHAESEFLFMLDADDVAAETRVADSLNFFAKHPRISIVYGEFSIINQLGVLMAHQRAVPFDYEKSKKDKFFYIGHSTMAIRRKVFDEVTYTDGEYSKHGIDDWKFQFDAHQAGFKFGAIPRILAKYRWIPKERDEKKIAELKEECLK